MNSGLTIKAQRVISQYAQEEAQKLGSAYIEPEHVFLGLIRGQDSIAVRVLHKLDINIEKISYSLENELKDGISTLKKGNIKASDRVKKVLNYSFEESRLLRHHYIGTEHLLLGIFREEESVISGLLSDQGISIGDLRKTTVELLGFGSFTKSVSKVVVEKKSYKTPTIDSFSRDLSQLAEEEKLDPVVAREKEIDRVIQILSRRTKNNPILIGEPGVGKSAIVEGLAIKIKERSVPEILQYKRIVNLDLAACIAGTKYRGEFEDRIKKIMNEIFRAENIILFIDEVHTIIGTGGAEGSMDASNILKPSLSRGEIQCIGATTLNEYKKYIERDSALARRFQKIHVEEPSLENSLKILGGLKKHYEKFHNTIYSTGALENAVYYAKRYLSDRQLPDTAIDLIDEAGAKVRIMNSNRPPSIKNIEEEIDDLNRKKKDVIKKQEFEKAAYLRDEIKKKKETLEERTENWKKERLKRKIRISSEDIARIVENLTGVPVTKIEKNEAQRISNMERSLGEQVLGQKEAITAISKVYRRQRAGLKNPRRPAGSFIFLGPTGVGKSELVKRLSEFIFGTKDALFKIDMSEFMEKHSVSRLIGAPPGYIGYQEGGQLTERIRQKPYSIILFDEIEKAHRDVFNILLQVLEDGRLTDHLGNNVDFSNAILIMTSNLGSKEMSDKLPFGFHTGGNSRLSYQQIKNVVMSSMKKHFSPEFLNRIDDIIVFNTLEKQHMLGITKLILVELQETLANKHIYFEVSNKLLALIAEKGFDRQYGARPVRRVIQNRIEDVLADAIVAKTVNSQDSLYLDYDELHDKVTITKKEKKEAKELPLPKTAASRALKTGDSENLAKPLIKPKPASQQAKLMKKKGAKTDEKKRLPAGP